MNDPPTSLSGQAKPKLGELSNQWASLQVCIDSSVALFRAIIISTPSCFLLQAPTATVDIFGDAAPSGSTAPPAESSTTPSLQFLQDLALTGFSNQKRCKTQLTYLKATCPWFCPSCSDARVSFPVRSSQVMATGGSFGMPVAAAAAAAPLLMTRQGSPASLGLLQHTSPGSPALAHVRAQGQSSAPGSPLFHSMSPSRPSPLQGSPARASDISLSNVHVALEAIRPSKIQRERGVLANVHCSHCGSSLIGSSGKVLPVTAYDKDGVRMLLNFASDCPPGRPDVLVMVVSMLNTAPLPVHNVQLQAAVPKVNRRHKPAKTLFCCFFLQLFKIQTISKETKMPPIKACKCCKLFNSHLLHFHEPLNCAKPAIKN